MKDKDFFTELSYRRQTVDDYGPTEITYKEAVWDLSLDALLDMFHCICIGASWEESNFESALVNYLETHGYEVRLISDNEYEVQD